MAFIVDFDTFVATMFVLTESDWVMGQRGQHTRHNGEIVLSVKVH